MSLTEAETRALLTSALLVALAAVGRTLLQPGPGDVTMVGITPAGSVDSALAVAESLYAERARRSAPLATDERIDLNTADERELDRLPGVGPALARAIIQHRERHGRFRSLGELERVPGLGSSTLNRLAPYVALPPGARVAGAGGGSATVGPRRSDRLDLNRASLDQLRTLPGIGLVKAEAILRWREEHGRFRRVDDLLQVPGIGPVTLERLRPLVGVGP